MNNILQKLGLKDGESIDHPWINKALERAQQKVEARNFDIRKTLIKFDNVLNDQRQVIFSQRKNAMNSENIFSYSEEFLKEIIDNLIKLKSLKLSNLKNNDFDLKLKSILGKTVDKNEYENLTTLKEDLLRKEIEKKFINIRKERINLIGEEQSKEIEKEFFYNQLI